MVLVLKTRFHSSVCQGAPLVRLYTWQLSILVTGAFLYVQKTLHHKRLCDVWVCDPESLVPCCQDNAGTADNHRVDTDAQTLHVPTARQYKVLKCDCPPQPTDVNVQHGNPALASGRNL